MQLVGFGDQYRWLYSLTDNVWRKGDSTNHLSVGVVRHPSVIGWHDAASIWRHRTHRYDSPYACVLLLMCSKHVFDYANCTSVHFPEAFFGGCVAIMALMAVSEIGIVHIFYKGDMGQPLTDTARHICFERIAPLMGMRSYVESLRRNESGRRHLQLINHSKVSHRMSHWRVYL